MAWSGWKAMGGNRQCHYPSSWAKGQTFVHSASYSAELCEKTQLGMSNTDAVQELMAVPSQLASAGVHRSISAEQGSLKPFQNAKP